MHNKKAYTFSLILGRAIAQPYMLCYTITMAPFPRAIFIINLIVCSSIILPFLANAALTRRPRLGVNLNPIDRCWRNNENWAMSRMDLARCSIGFAGRMSRNRGKDVMMYEVTDSSDVDPANPRPGTLRYGATMLLGKVWITFKSDMFIKLKRPLFVSAFTTIDGRGANVHIAYGSGVTMHEVTDVIIHGLHFHDIKSTSGGNVIVPGGHVVPISAQDLDAIRIVASRKIWVDHNTLSRGDDGLIDASIASTMITISNNRFMDHDKVMLLGHDDSYTEDWKMKVTLLYNHFGPSCHQRMPRIRFGYVHIVNNLYEGWDQYAIGGGMNPTIMSQGNWYIAVFHRFHKRVTWKENGENWHVKSVDDVLDNGAIFTIQASEERTLPRYGKLQKFEVRPPHDVHLLTKEAGALLCYRGRIC